MEGPCQLCGLSAGYIKGCCNCIVVMNTASLRSVGLVHCAPLAVWFLGEVVASMLPDVRYAITGVGSLSFRPRESVYMSVLSLSE